MLKKIIYVVGLIIAVLMGGFLIWASGASGPMPAALTALQSNGAVQVEIKPWFIFKPVGQEPSTGLIIYPGGKVDPRSYAPEIGRAHV